VARYAARTRVVVLALTPAAIPLLVGGCAAQAVVEVYQPHADEAERLVRLTTFSAYFDTAPPVERVLLAFPLPGSWAGRTEYYLYLRLLEHKGTCRVGQVVGSQRVCGFFVQKSGRLAGLTELVEGQIVTKGVAFDGGRKRQGQLDVTCTDGTRITGRFLAELAPWQLRDFEQQRHAADVQALLQAARTTSETGKDRNGT